MNEIRDYIACQITPESLDELQRMALCRDLGCHVALDGPPGVGKTQSILAFARLAAIPVFEKGCSEDTTESQIIGFPKLVEENGATVTTYENGPLAKAMAAGGVFYGDEFNLLRRDKQKRLNSAFDDRRHIVRADDVEIKAATGFFGAISYNPTGALSQQDLEDSVADRFIHLHYGYVAQPVESYMAALRGHAMTGGGRPRTDLYKIQLERRAIVFGREPGDRSRFLLYDPEKKTWLDFFSGTVVPDPTGIGGQSIGAYFAQRPAAAHSFNTQPLPGEEELARAGQEYVTRVTAFFVLLRAMMEGGITAMPKRARSAYDAFGEIGDLVVHPPSLRIAGAATGAHLALLRSGMAQSPATTAASRFIIEQVCYGKYRERPNGEHMTIELVEALAEFTGLGILRKKTQHINTDYFDNGNGNA